uniref:Coiled-coil domain containing 78 n=1 Tax=Paramormyrops kingsleyae TaxID=1676925 RepID=A0A3B3S1I8_9TELE|nr:coiled-coil domain-containing protein 78 [Paramormyrops kingsleyae]
MDIQENLKSQLQDRDRHLTDENIQLRDKNESVSAQLGAIQSKLDETAGSKAELSTKLIFSEEEKLKMSKDVIEVQIQTNKMKERYEAEAYELKNKILFLENRLMELEVEKDRSQRETQYAKGCLHAAEKNHKELVDEYVTLKSNYLALTEEHDREVSRNQELSEELLELAQAQDTLLKRSEGRAQRMPGREAAAELDRVRELVSRMSQHRLKPDELMVSEQERKILEEKLLRKQEELKEELERMKQHYEGQQRHLEDKMMAMSKEQQENKQTVHNIQHQLSKQTVALLSSQNQLKEVEMENSRLQLQVKELNEEYRARLQRYLQDFAEHLDQQSRNREAEKAPDEGHTRRFVNSVLQDVKTSYRSREEQLASAARMYKKRLRQTTRGHEALLVEYRMQREQILALADRGLVPGPPESHFCLLDGELRTDQGQELQRLREDKARLEHQLRDALEQSTLRSVSLLESGNPRNTSEEMWTDIRKELKDFVHSTLEVQERERAQLLTRAAVAEGQLSELQEYVDKHLGRYKEEITHLRHLLDTKGSRPRSAVEPKSDPGHHSKRSTSHEI